MIKWFSNFLKFIGGGICSLALFVLASCIVIPALGLVMLCGTISAFFGALYAVGKFGFAAGRLGTLQFIMPRAQKMFNNHPVNILPDCDEEECNDFPTKSTTV